MDTRAALLVLVAVLVLAVSFGLPVGSGAAARTALDWVVVAVPVVLTALGRPVTRA